jgi:hypothetical protein
MKRFQKKSTPNDNSVDASAFLLADDDDYLSEIKETSPKGDSSSQKKALTSVSDVLREYQESFPSSGSNKRQKINELMNITREIGLQKPLIELNQDSVVPSLGKKNIGLKLLQKFGYGQTAADTVKEEEGQKTISQVSGDVVLKGLGKNEKGITEPLSLHDSHLPGRNTTGLGMQKHLERKELTKLKHLSSLKSTFQQQWINHSLYKKKRKDYYSILRVIYELDCRNDYIFTLPETKEMHSDIEKKMFSLTEASEEKEDQSTVFFDKRRRRFYDDNKTRVTTANDIDEIDTADVVDAVNDVVELDGKNQKDEHSSYRIPSLRDLNGNEEVIRYDICAMIYSCFFYIILLLPDVFLCSLILFFVVSLFLCFSVFILFADNVSQLWKMLSFHFYVI